MDTLVACFTSIICGLLVRISLATHRCPPYSLNFAAYGLPECEPSYLITSKQEFETLMKTLKCIGFGQWKVPTAKGCSSPADLPAAMLVDYPCQCHLGGKCRLKCQDNYELVGNEFMECSPLTSTYNIDATCMKTSCKNPTLPENVQKVEGRCDLTGDCELRCVSEVLRMKGGNVIRCKNRAWSELPLCIMVCKLADVRSDLKRQGNCTGELEEMCPVECLDAALTLNGPINIACQATGQWSEMPQCGCNPNALPQGVFLAGACAVAAGTRCAAGCAADYEMDVSSVLTIQCDVDGKWQTAESIKCLRVCVGPPALPSNMVLGAACDKTVEGKGCPVGCREPNMHLVGSAEVICLATGLYSAMPHCALPDKCPSDLFDKMNVGDCDFRVGVTCTVTCRDLLHKLVGNATMTCKISGDWDQVPKCKRICVAHAPNASMSIAECGNLEDETCTFKCADNYAPTEPIVITCLENGEWSSVPKCVKMCSEPVIPSSMVKAAECSRLPNAECELACRESNYKIVPNSKIRCQAESSQWTKLPECKKKCSSSIPTMYSMEVEGQCDEVEGSKCQLKCKNFWEGLTGKGFLECTEDGWDQGENECAGLCGTPPVDSNDIEVTYEGDCNPEKAVSTCNLTCRDSRANVRQGTAICDYGKWEIVNVDCDVKCGPILLRPGAHAAGAQECSRVEGTECKIKCNKPNFFMDGKPEFVIRCEDQKWTEAPLCEIQCDPLAVPEKLKLKQPCAVKNNSVCQVQCVDEGVIMQGDPIFICQAPVWKGNMPSCAKTCLPPSEVSFQFDGACSMRENVACKVKCSQGVRVGPDAVTCLETRSWSQFPECK